MASAATAGQRHTLGAPGGTPCLLLPTVLESGFGVCALWDGIIPKQGRQLTQLLGDQWVREEHPPQDLHRARKFKGGCSVSGGRPAGRTCHPPCQPHPAG